MSTLAPLEPAVLDVSVVAAIRALGGPDEPDVFAEVARLFLEDVPIHLAALADAIKAQRSDLVTQIAHRLRGGALEMGAVRMAPLCLAIERAARIEQLDRAPAMAECLRREFIAARSAIEEVIR
jgi:HPt (histidine-containing phosphotransfer) domain-containing protein